jgi:hypothetical protein
VLGYAGNAAGDINLRAVFQEPHPSPRGLPMSDCTSMPPSGPAALPYALAIAALTLASHQAAADAKIGVAAAIKNDVLGRSGALAVGSSVFANERIRTGDAAAAQLMFADKTVLNMGPKAELMLDKYVYNPNRGTGQVVVNAVQGSLRFVTGAQNPTNYAIKTPVATLGIRGTVVDLQISPLETFIGVLEGTLTVRMMDGALMTVAAGQYVVIAANGTKKASGPYKGTGATQTDLPEYIRIDEINQLNAIEARNYVPPKPACIPYSFSSSCYPNND